MPLDKDRGEQKQLCVHMPCPKDAFPLNELMEEYTKHSPNTVASDMIFIEHFSCSFSDAQLYSPLLHPILSHTQQALVLLKNSVGFLGILILRFYKLCDTE